MKKYGWIFLLSTMLCAQEYYKEPHAKHFSVQIKEKSERIALDQTGALKLQVSYPKNYQIHKVAYENDSSVVTWKPEKVQQLDQEESNQEVFTLYFEPQKLGEHYLNLPTFHFCQKDNEKQFESLHPPLVKCIIEPSGQDPLNNLCAQAPVSLNVRRPVELSATNQNLLQQTGKELLKVSPKFQFSKISLYWKLGALICLLCAAALFFFKGFLKKNIRILFKGEQDPRLVAFERLRLLKEKDLPSQGLFEAFYVELTQLVRQFIEEQYKIRAPGQTTQEFLHKLLGATLFQLGTKNLLGQFLEFADLVKFAQLRPEISECEQAEKAALNFIQASLDE